MVETNQLEAYITRTFSRITDDYNRPLNITAAAPTLLDIISGNNDAYANHHYDFIGESATTFAIDLILSKQYPKFNKLALRTLAKKFTGFLRLHKTINQEIRLKDHVLAPYLTDTLNSIIGVLYSYYGIVVVEKFITSSVIHVANLELNEVIPNPKEKNLNPLYTLQLMITTQNGHFEAPATAVNGQWTVKIMAKLTSNGTLFSHARSASNKRKAKTEAAQDILAFLQDHGEICEQLKMPAPNAEEEYILPVNPNEYCQLEPACQSSITTGWANDANSAHIEDNDDTLQRLSDLLLGGQRTDTDERSQTKKRPRQNMFSSSEPVTYIKQEEEFKLFDQVVENPADRAIMSFFKTMFQKNHSLLSSTKMNPGQSKSVLLSLIVPQKDILHVDVKTSQAGSSHEPLFRSEVILKSKVKAGMFLKTEGLAQKKRDAEQTAFKKLIELITQ